MSKLMLGEGFKYLMSSVIRGDGAVDLSTPLARYYAESGTPAGRWIGSGIANLGDPAGLLAAGQVTEEHLMWMLCGLLDPSTGEPLGRRPMKAAAGLSTRRSVAAFDLTFSVPKSLSTAWAVADPATQQVIYEAHIEAISTVIGWAEKQVFFTRTGRNGVVQEPILGVHAAGFDHWDSRAGDPQLHTHVVVANRVMAADGKWRTLDSDTLFDHVVTLSELHHGVVEDLITARLGWDWSPRSRRHSDRPKWEVAGVPDALSEEFSTRSKQMEIIKEHIIGEFVAREERQPTPDEVLRIRQAAVLGSRPKKQHHALADQITDWRSRATRFVGNDTESWVAGLRHTRGAQTVLPAVEEVTTVVLEAVQSRRATFTRANVLAETHRQLHGYRFDTAAARIEAAEAITGHVLDHSMLLTPLDRSPVPAALRHSDGSSKLQPTTSLTWTTRQIFDTEESLLLAGHTLTGPVVPRTIVARIGEVALPERGYVLADDQLLAIEQIATSARVLDVLVGPAGTGKTTALAGLIASWIATHGDESVIGLAPSAAAAEGLAREANIGTDTLAKFLHDKRSLAANQLVIVDEASLAGTFDLGRILTSVTAGGAKLLLVGDPFQLAAVDAGGAFRMLVNDRESAPELTGIHRFTHEWEKSATLRLRTGDESVIDIYLREQRVFAGSREDMIDVLYRSWRRDSDHNLNSLMIAGDTSTVDALNARAQADLVTRGVVSAHGVELRSGDVIRVGDLILTRHNDRRLSTSADSFVKNGDRWKVTGIRRDGALRVHRDSGSGGAAVLPPAYVAEHVQLGYAVTAHRAQGATVDTAHSMINPATTREVLYVSATRGRSSNQLYVDVQYDPTEATSHGPTIEQDVDNILRGALRNEGAELSAHDMSAVLACRANSLELQAADTTELPPPATNAQGISHVDLVSSRRDGLTLG